MDNKICEIAMDYGFTHAVIMASEKITYVPMFREGCEENLCGNYGANYSCPPYSGTVAEMIESTKPYSKVLVLETNITEVDAADMGTMKAIKKDHSDRSRKLLKELKKAGLLGPGLSMLAGPCSLCPSCKMKEGKPCPFPEERASCLSAYTVNVTKLAEDAGIPISWDLDQVSFFSLYLFNEV